MTGVTYAEADSSSPAAPLKVVYMGTMLALFHYPTAMPVGKCFENKQTLQLKLLDNRFFKFILKKKTEKTVSVICERHVEDETLNSDSAVEADDGCFLVLNMSIIGLRERSKSAVMRCTDTSTSVEFLEDSLFDDSVRGKYYHILKCVVKRIETTVLSNKFAREQKLLWKECMEKVGMSDRQEKDIAYLLQRPRPMEFLTGRRTRYNSTPHIISRACCYSKELVHYFKSKENSELVSPTIDVGLILGYLYDGRKTAISRSECRSFYMYSLFEGLTFVKELCAQFVVQNLNGEFIVDAFEIAVMTGDEKLFDAVYFYYTDNNIKLLEFDNWKRLFRENSLALYSIMNSIMHRRSLDYFGCPPAMADENGEARTSFRAF